ncbi:MAG TPA: 4Fe-4S dicluster domain-containing protein, partial [Kofleriaceae bacterium]|nr:4Fe-4S dicluster domain-containing protein [Kofleriaceae bacterium]
MVAVAPLPDPTVASLRALPLLAGVPDHVLAHLVAQDAASRVELARDALLEPRPGALCLVVEGQLSLGVFDPSALAARGRPQRDAALGEQDGTLMPPGPLARAAKQNLALFRAGELFNLGAIASATGDDVVRAFSLTRVVAVLIGVDALAWIAEHAPDTEQALATALGATNARLRAVTGIKHEILDFYMRNGMSVAGPTVRVRQLDLCIDCKQCEEACETRHGAQRLTLGGYELGLLDFVFTCRTCADARCLSPCEHDAIKRDPRSGEIQIIEDRCIGCSLCALSCPYGAIDMINVAEPELPSYSPRFKARLEHKGSLAFGPGKGRKAPARRIANKCDHCAGYADQACVSACPTGSLIEIAPAALFRERPDAPRTRLPVLPERPFIEGLGVRDSGEARVRVRKLSLLLWVIGLGSFLAVLAEVALRWFHPTWSASYYLMTHHDGIEPAIAEMNVSFLAGTKLALTCGYVGTALMALSMAYLLQRRFGWFKRTASNQFWLDVHLMTGIVGPLFIVLHSALRLTTWVSVPFWSMIAVVVSGAIGRYLYTLVPALTSKHDLAILAARRALTEAAADHPAAANLAYDIVDAEARHAGRAWQVGLTTLLGWILADDLRRWWQRRSHLRRLREVAPRPVARRLARHIDRIAFYERR